MSKDKSTQLELFADAATAHLPESFPLGAPVDENGRRITAKGRKNKYSSSQAVVSTTHSAPLPRGRRVKIDYVAFGRAINGYDVDKMDPDEMRGVLRASGYTHLIGKGGERLTLDEASDDRVYKVMQRVRNAYENKKH